MYTTLTLFLISFCSLSSIPLWAIHFVPLMISGVSTRNVGTFQYIIKFHKLSLSLRLIVEIFILKLYLICLRKYKEIRWRLFINVILLFEWLINIHEEKGVNVCSISNILFKLPLEEFYIILLHIWKFWFKFNVNSCDDTLCECTLKHLIDLLCD